PKRCESGVQFRLQRRESEDCICSPMPSLKEIYPLAACNHHQLWYQRPIGFGREDRFDSIGLRSHRVDEADLLAATEIVDVVSTRKLILVLRRGVGWREEDAVPALHWDEVRAR